MHRPPSRERATFSFRLSDSERRILEAAAVQRRLWLGEFVRTAALEIAKRELGVPGEARLEAR